MKPAALAGREIWFQKARNIHKNIIYCLKNYGIVCMVVSAIVLMSQKRVKLQSLDTRISNKILNICFNKYTNIQIITGSCKFLFSFAMDFNS